MKQRKNRLVPSTGTKNIVRTLLKVIVPIGAILFSVFFLLMKPQSSDGGYADAGSGIYHNHIFWFTWENGSLADGIDDGDSKTFTVPGGQEITATFSNTSGDASDYVASDMNTWSGSVAHRYYQISSSNGEAFYGGNADDCSFRVSFTATLDGISYTPDLIFIDPESTDSGEDIQVTTNGEDWEIIETLPEGSISLSLSNPKVIQIVDGSAKVPVLLSRSANQLDVSANGGGRQGVCFGLWFSMDFGDAPDSYGTQDHSSGAKHLLDPSRPLYLGSQVDAESDGSASGTGAEDNSDGNNDEDGVSFPATLNVISGYTLAKTQIQLTNESGSDATLHAWIDFDLDGVFEANEYASTTVSDGIVNGNPNSDLVWSGIANGVGGSSYARFRLTTDSNINSASPGGLAMDGEVEDYPITMSYPSFPVEWLSLDARWNGNSVLVSWQTASESNSDYFQIERQVSQNGLFQAIGTEKAAGHSDEVQTYGFVDLEAAQMPTSNQIMYRIKQVDVDGTFQHSQLIELQGERTESKLQFSISPNPATDHIQVQLETALTTPAKLSVRNIDGQQVAEHIITGAEHVPINVSSWSRGMYILTLSNEQDQASKQLVVK